MAVIEGTIVGITEIFAPTGGTGDSHTFAVSVTFPAYTASADTTNVAAVGAAISANRRDGLTATLRDVSEGQPGLQGTTRHYHDTLLVSTDAITGELSNAAGTEADALSGVTDQPCVMLVTADLA